MEKALEFVSDYPELTEPLKEEQFAVFWSHTDEVLKQYNASIQMLRTSFQFTDEMIKENCLDYLADACNIVISDLNLNTP